MHGTIFLAHMSPRATTARGIKKPKSETYKVKQIIALFVILLLSLRVAAVTTFPITESTWNSYRLDSSLVGGFSANIRAGSSASNTTEFGVTPLMMAVNADVDLPGGWNWGVPYDFQIANGASGITVTIAGITSPAFVPSITSSGFAFGAYANFPFAGNAITNLSIDGNPLGDLSTSWTGDRFQGYEFTYPSNWKNISGKLTMECGLPGVLEPFSDDVYFSVIATNSVSPEPGRTALFVMGFICLFLRRQR